MGKSLWEEAAERSQSKIAKGHAAANRGDTWGAGDPEAWGDLGDVAMISHGPAESRQGVPMRLFFGQHPHGRNDKNMYVLPLGKNQDPIGFDGHRFCTVIQIEEFNYHKSSDLSGDQIRKATELRVFFDDEKGSRHLRYVRMFREIEQAMHWWLWHHFEFSENWLQIFRQADLAKLEGTKLWYREQPVIAVAWDPRRWLMVRFDLSAKFQGVPLETTSGVDLWDVQLRIDGEKQSPQES